MCRWHDLVSNTRSALHIPPPFQTQTQQGQSLPHTRRLHHDSLHTAQFMDTDLHNNNLDEKYAIGWGRTTNWNPTVWRSHCECCKMTPLPPHKNRPASNRSMNGIRTLTLPLQVYCSAIFIEQKMEWGVPNFIACVTAYDKWMILEPGCIYGTSHESVRFPSHPCVRDHHTRACCVLFRSHCCHRVCNPPHTLPSCTALACSVCLLLMSSILPTIHQCNTIPKQLHEAFDPHQFSHIHIHTNNFMSLSVQVKANCAFLWNPADLAFCWHLKSWTMFTPLYWYQLNRTPLSNLLLEW